MCDDLVYEPASFSPLGIFLSCVNLSTNGSAHYMTKIFFLRFQNLTYQWLEVYTLFSVFLSIYVSIFFLLARDLSTKLSIIRDDLHRIHIAKESLIQSQIQSSGKRKRLADLKSKFRTKWWDII